MAYYTPDPGEEIRMPSDDRYFVRVRTRVYQPQRKAVAGIGLATGTEIIDGGTRFLVSMILDWNLTGEDEQKLPITFENVDQKLLGPDYKVVFKRCQEIVVEAEAVATPLVTPSSQPEAATESPAP